MSFYQVNLALFAAGNAYLLYRQYAGERREKQGEQELGDQTEQRESAAAVRKFQIQYFSVYALAVAVDWLQVNWTSPTQLCNTG